MPTHFSRRLVFAIPLCAGCAASLPLPPLASHRPDDFVEVPYPPPAALVETVPPQPEPRAVWVDGYWDWGQSEYIWVRGGWVDPPEASRLAPWVSGYAKDGRLMFARSVWYDELGRQLPEPKVLRPAYTPPNEITGEFQAPR